MDKANSRGVVAIVGPVPPPYGGMALQGQALRENLLREGIEAQIVATNPRLPAVLSRIKGLRTVLQTLIYLWALIRVVPEVAVVHVLGASHLYFFLRVIPAVLLGRLIGRRVVLNYRGGEGPQFLAARGWIARPVIRLASVVTVPSSYLQRSFARYQIYSTIVPNIVDLNRFKFRPRTQLRPYLLVSRNLDPIYNVGMAVRAFERIKRVHADARLDIVGGGTEETKLKTWVRERRLEDVFFYGPVPNEKMPFFLERADILLNPSNVDNLPINLLEAFASGVPVVTTAVGGIPDLVGNEPAALLVEPDNDLQMARRVEELLNSGDSVRRVTSRALDLAKNFSWEAVRKRLFEVYFPKDASPSRERPCKFLR